MICHDMCCLVLVLGLQDSPAGAMAIAGVVGGVFAASASHPFDTIKTRMQAHMYSKPEYLTWTSTAATIYKEGGILNFWSGLLPRMTRIIGGALS
jgi:solute carrier family 25 citrate transporter 1